MLDDTEIYTLARFSNRHDAENAQRHLTESGVDSEIVPEEQSDLPADLAWALPALLRCRSSDRIQAILVLERARVL